MSADALPIHTATAYVARVSSERTWQHVIKDPFSAEFTDAYLVAGSFSRAYRDVFSDRIRLEMELNAAYNFGEQHHWELNAAPIFVRWQRFPWDAYLATSAAFGLGLSYASEVPEVEVELEGESHKALIFWVFELTAGSPRAPWSVTLRLHHRSVAWGLMGDDGGVNALGIGLRYQFR